MSFPFFDDETTPETPRIPLPRQPLSVVPTPTPARPPVRLTTRGKVVLWILWFVTAYHLSPVAEFWWTKI